LLGIGELDGQIKLWSRASQNLLAKFHAHDGEIDGLIFSADGSVLISIGKDQTVKLWQVMSQKQIVEDMQQIASRQQQQAPVDSEA